MFTHTPPFEAFFWNARPPFLVHDEFRFFFCFIDESKKKTPYKIKKKKDSSIQKINNGEQQKGK